VVEPVKTVACQFQFQFSHSVQSFSSATQFTNPNSHPEARINSLGMFRGDTKERMGWEQVVEAGGQNVVVNGLLCTQWDHK
jgi:hypothetical protein